MNTKTLIPALALYLVSTGVSFAAFNYLGSPSAIQAPPERTETGGLDIDPSEPKTQACPLNGELFTKTEERAWEVRRPLAVMINNHLEARPQSGIGSADIVYEAIAEGGVTRFMGLFYCDAISIDTIIAPVRSARTYFVDWASEYNQPMYVHAGGANCSADKYENGSFGPCKTDKRAQAIEQISQYGWRLENDIDHMSIGKPVFWRDTARLGNNRQIATEHTLSSSTEELWKLAEKRDWTNLNPDGDDWIDDFVPWTFLDEDDQVEGDSASKIAYPFWDGYDEFAVSWQYDASTGQYLRTMGGEPHTDLKLDQQVTAKNVVIIFTKETDSVDDLKHILYETIGSDDALVFQQGKVIKATWSKKSRTARTIFTDSSGDEISFDPGKIWLSVLDNSVEVEY